MDINIFKIRPVHFGYDEFSEVVNRFLTTDSISKKEFYRSKIRNIVTDWMCNLYEKYLLFKSIFKSFTAAHSFVTANPMLNYLTNSYIIDFDEENSEIILRFQAGESDSPKEFPVVLKFSDLYDEDFFIKLIEKSYKKGIENLNSVIASLDNDFKRYEKDIDTIIKLFSHEPIKQDEDISHIVCLLKRFGYLPEVIYNDDKDYYATIKFVSHGSENFPDWLKDAVRGILNERFYEFEYQSDCQYIKILL